MLRVDGQLHAHVHNYSRKLDEAGGEIANCPVHRVERDSLTAITCAFRQLSNPVSTLLISLAIISLCLELEILDYPILYNLQCCAINLQCCAIATAKL